MEIRTSTAEQAAKLDPVGSTQAIATIALLLQSLNSAHTFTSTRKFHTTRTPIGPRSDAEVRYANSIGGFVEKRRGFTRGKSCGRMRSMTSTLCYLADPFSFVTAREANKRFNLAIAKGAAT